MSVVIGEELLAALKKGLALNVGFQNLQKTPVTVSMPLDGFTNRYEQIKVH